MKQTLLRVIAMLCAASWVTGCQAPAPTEALFKDVAKRPPDAQPGTIDALAEDPDFAVWVIYQDRACDRWGCAE